MDQSFDAKPETVARARRVLTGWLAGSDIDHVSDLTLAVGELVANAVRHGKAPIRLLMARHAGKVRVEVHDHGGGRPALRALQTTGPGAGGWGLRFVEQVTDRWGTYTRDGLTVVWVERVITSQG